MKRMHLAAICLAAVLGFLAVLLAPAPAEAIPECGYFAQFFSDPGYTNLIGERWVTTTKCGCYYDGWGSAGGYKMVIDNPTCGIEV